jgi:hypothetical protein
MGKRVEIFLKGYLLPFSFILAKIWEYSKCLWVNDWKKKRLCSVPPSPERDLT